MSVHPYDEGTRGETGRRKQIATVGELALPADTKLIGRYFQVMARSAVDKIPSGPKLDALTAEKVFGWRKVHKHQGALVGRKQDKAGHWRRAKVPNYSTPE
jgi:hypothetical protein